MDSPGENIILGKLVTDLQTGKQSKAGRASALSSVIFERRRAALRLPPCASVHCKEVLGAAENWRKWRTRPSTNHHLASE